MFFPNDFFTKFGVPRNDKNSQFQSSRFGCKYGNNKMCKFGQKHSNNFGN